MDDHNPECNYQKLVDPYPPYKYDIFMGYNKWDKKPKNQNQIQSPCFSNPRPHKCEKKEIKETVVTDPSVSIYLHLLPKKEC